MRVLCCNIRTSDAPDGSNGWRYRRDFCLEVIRAHSPSLVCLQEVSNLQYKDVVAAFPDFESQQFREGAGRDYPVNTVLYRRDEYELVSSGGYWLSATPHVAGSRDWNTLYVRLANWLRLVERASGRRFRIVNTHLDIVSDFTRYRQAQVINRDVQGYSNDYPQILAGDMNSTPDAAAIRSFRRIGWKDVWGAARDDASGYTYHGFAGDTYGTPDAGRIDYVFTRGQIGTAATEIIRDRDLSGRYPSDHYFLQADLSFK